MYFYALVSLIKRGLHTGQIITQIDTIPFHDQKAMVAFARFKKDQGYEVYIWEYERNGFDMAQWKEYVFH